MENKFNLTNSINDAVVSELVSTAFKSILSLFKKKNEKKDIHELPFNFEDKLLANHFNELYNWCKELEFIGLGGKPISTIIKTIQLDFEQASNRRPSIESETSPISEDEFINSSGNIILEGDPGSGKTTTIKRLLYKYFFNTSRIESIFSYPVLIRFRSIEDSTNIYLIILNLLGINYETRQEIYYEKVIKSRKIKVKDENNKIHEIYENYEAYEEKTRPIYFINNERIENEVVRLLESNKVLLIMDGLDELKPELQQGFQKQIQEIGLKLFSSKIVITSRPNYVKVNFPTFSIYEVGLLKTSQIEVIASLWLTDYKNFMKELEIKSYFELTNRPLFLTFLILLYTENRLDKDKHLPKSSKDVYEQIIELLIIKWDKARSIVRKSKYADFNEKKKIQFLSFLSFRVTYITKEKIFTHQQLIEEYIAICPHFNLPLDEAELVAEEIENHTGIIIKSLYNKYEFSHLAIQEYLCANYIIGAPFTENIDTYLDEYPPPLALAVSLSTDPSLWLTELLVRLYRSRITLDRQTQIAAQILHRLDIESPYFEKRQSLAISLLTLCKNCDCKNDYFKNSFEKFITDNNAIEESIFELLKLYKKLDSTEYDMTIAFSNTSPKHINLPSLLYLPKTTLLEKKFV